MDFDILYIVIGVVLLLNLLVSVYLLRNDELEPFQKGAQILIVWLIPFIAAIGLWLFHRNDEVEAKKYKEFGGGSRDHSGISSGGD